MARPRAATYDDQRSQILAAAAAAFAHHGYAGTTMNEVAAACGISKATLYHYFADKGDLLEQIARGHVSSLEALVDEVAREHLAPEAHLRALIARFMAVYAGAQNAHRVLTEDVKFLGDDARRAVEDGQRRVVAAFTRAVAGACPDLDPGLRTPLAMLLFGMINWTFTWLKPGGALTHPDLGGIVADLFFGGLPAVSPAGKKGRPIRPAAVPQASH